MDSIKSSLLIAEADLVYRLQCHDTTAFEAFYKQYAAALFSMILRIIKDEEKAEDILQESLIKIWNSVDSYKPNRGQLFTWASNISRNLAIDTLRSTHQNSSNSEAETLYQAAHTPTKLNNLQINLLRLFERGMSDEEVVELRQVLVAHMSRKLLEEVERVNEERGYTSADAEAMLNDPS